jgi:uncharacterized protein (TIGR02284 family)
MYSYNNPIPAINYLKQLCRKRKEGYTKAAEIVKEPNIEKLFIKYAKQSDDFEYELLHYSNQDHVDSDAYNEFSMRGWQNFYEEIDEPSLENILAVCEKKEKETMGDYENALEEELPEEIEQLINRQLIEITDAYDTIMDIKGNTSNHRPGKS